MLEFLLFTAGAIVAGFVLLVVVFKVLAALILLPLKLGAIVIKILLGVLIVIPVAVAVAVIGAVAIPVVFAVLVPLLLVLAIPALLVGLLVGFFKLIL